MSTKPDELAMACRAAGSAHVAAINSGDASAILVTYRAALAAESAMLRDCGGRYDVATADELDCMIADLDKEIACGAVK